MEVVNVNQARTRFAELMDKVVHDGQRVVIARRGKPMLAWIPIDELLRLEEKENEMSQHRAARLRALADAEAARQRIETERNGAPLPDAAEAITHLRTERSDELAGMR